MSINHKLEPREWSELVRLLDHFGELAKDHATYINGKELLCYDDVAAAYGQEDTYERMMDLWNKASVVKQ